MNEFPALISDRTKSDVDNGTDKGHYNYSDLNRVETATRYLADILTESGYIVTITTKDDWTMQDIPYEEQMQRYLNNVKLCVTQFCNTGIPLPYSMSKIDYIDANNIEKTLEVLNEFINHMIADYRHCGTLNSNQHVLPQNVFLGRTWAELDAMNWDWATWNTKTWFSLLY